MSYDTEPTEDKSGAKESTKKLSASEVRDIVTDFDKAIKESGWGEWAEKSWKEYRRQDSSITTKRTKKFPLWWATNKVRKSLVLAKEPLVVVTPTTAEKNQFVNDCAEVVQKFAESLQAEKPILAAAYNVRDDALLTGLGVSRIIFKTDKVKQPVKQYLTITEVEGQDEQGQPVVQEILVDEAGEQVDPSLVLQDTEGQPYIETEESEEVERECVYLKSVCYKNFIWDVDATDFNGWEYCGFRQEYSRRQISMMFGAEVLNKLPEAKTEEDRRKKLELIELWHKPTNMLYIVCQQGGDEIAAQTDPMGIQWFFPIVPPVLTDTDTEGSIPITEYQQVVDLLDDVNEQFQILRQGSELVRPRGLYDDGIPELKTAIGRGKRGQYIGVKGLAAKLQQGQTLISYVDTSAVVSSLQYAAQQMQSSMTSYDQITGFSDVVRGVTNPFETATAVERKSQFAVSRLTTLQEDMQRWCRDGLRLMVDVALEKFSDERIYEAVEHSLTSSQKEQFSKILDYVRRDHWRSMTISIETNSTLMLDEDEQKQQAVELGTIVGQLVQQIAQSVSQAPATVPLLAQVSEHVISRFRGGRAFQESIAVVIEQMQQELAAQAQQQAPDPAMAKVEIEQQRLNLQQMEMQAKLQAEASKQRIAEMKVQLDAQLGREGLTLEQRQQAFDEFYKQADLEFKKVIETLHIQEKFVEERRLSQQLMIQAQQPQQAQEKGSNQPTIIQPIINNMPSIPEPVIEPRLNLEAIAPYGTI